MENIENWQENWFFILILFFFVTVTTDITVFFLSDFLAFPLIFFYSIFIVVVFV